MNISILFAITYFLMVGFLYFRFRAISSYSHPRCLIIALTSSLPFILKTGVNGLLLGSNLAIEAGFMLGGTSSKELADGYTAKQEAQKERSELGDNDIH